MSQPIKRESLPRPEEKTSLEPKVENAIKLDLERYQEALVAFIGAEFDAGATREEIEQFYRAQMAQGGSHTVSSRSHGSERIEMDAAASVLRSNYNRDGWKTISNWYFEDALNAYENVDTIYKSKESDAA